MWLVFGVGAANIIATIAVAYMKGNENIPSQATAAAQPIVPGDTPQAGVRPPAPRP